MNNTAKSRGAWGRKTYTPAELNAFAHAFFDALVLPKSWEFVGFSHADDNGIRISVGKVYKDKSTSGMELMHYRVFVAERKGGICEKSIVDFGKFQYKTVVSNVTAEQLNEYIKLHYMKIPSENSGNSEEKLNSLREIIDGYGQRNGD